VKSVIVIGGGVAGLSSSVFLKAKGFDVTLIESSPKLGGRTYSFYDKEKEMFFDNGQHILAGWYENTFAFLKAIGSYDRLNFQNRLEVNFIDTEKKVYRLKCPDAPAPMNLIRGLLKYGALNFRDKAALLGIRLLFNESRNSGEGYTNVSELLRGIRQTPNLMKFFWEPFILAVFNNRPENIDADLFVRVLKKGFSRKLNSALVIPDINLNELFVEPAVEYFRKNDVKMILGNGVEKIQITNGRCEFVHLRDGEKIGADYFVCAVPFFAFRSLFDKIVLEENKFKSQFLKPSGIVSVHLFFDKKIPKDLIPDNSFGMTGLLGTIVQWIFRRSDFHLSLVISGADDLQITNLDNEEIYTICVNDLKNTITGFDKLNISGFKVIKEKRATFVPDFSSKEFRSGIKTKYENFFIAGDWTDTGLPATIESAATSARMCADAITAIDSMTLMS